MKTEPVTLAELEEIARTSGTRPAVDSVRHVAYLRRAQTKYVAPLDELAEMSA